MLNYAIKNKSLEQDSKDSVREEILSFSLIALLCTLIFWGFTRFSFANDLRPFRDSNHKSSQNELNVDSVSELTLEFDSVANNISRANVESAHYVKTSQLFNTSHPYPISRNVKAQDHWDGVYFLGTRGYRQYRHALHEAYSIKNRIDNRLKDNSACHLDVLIARCIQQ